jgi:hypothetical protein
MANGHGGWRPGAGRKRGSANRKTREVANTAAKNGLSPLEFALQIMRDSAQPMVLRAEMAAMAMPYCHARLSPVLPDTPEAPRTVAINIISYPGGTSIDRDGTVRLPPPPIDVDIVEAEGVAEEPSP